MAVTYLYENRADRADGEVEVVSRGAAVYETIEEALFQAGVDESHSAQPYPLRIIAGAHHGYVFDAHDVEAKALAGRAEIRKAAAIARRYLEDISDPDTPRTKAEPFLEELRTCSES